MPGYKVSLVGNTASIIREGLKCSYCRLLLKDPIQTSESGLRYCRECFKEAVRYVYTVMCVDARRLAGRRAYAVFLNASLLCGCVYVYRVDAGIMRRKNITLRGNIVRQHNSTYLSIL